MFSSSPRSALLFVLLGPAVGSLPFVVATGIAGLHATTGPLGGLLLVT
jgi:hypothetical protein